MTTPSERPSHNSFSGFGFGLVVGLGAAFLFGTEEGRKVLHKLISSLPAQAPVNLNPYEETSHHAQIHTHFGTSSFGEAPPPPAPHVRPTRPEPFQPKTTL